MKLWVLPLVCYFMAFMALCVEFLPEPALAIFGGRIEGDTRAITLITAFVFSGIGALLHWGLYRLNPERFETALMIKVGTAMAMVLVGMFLVSALVSISTGAPPAAIESRTRDFMSWLGIAIAGGMLLLLAGAKHKLPAGICCSRQAAFYSREFYVSCGGNLRPFIAS